MVTQLFSDRERGSRPRTSEIVGERAWAGLVAHIHQRVVNGSFGSGFPKACPDHEGTIGCDSMALGMALRAEVDIDWPLIPHQTPHQVDYLFFRMFAFLQLLLRASGRGG